VNDALPNVRSRQYHTIFENPRFAEVSIQLLKSWMEITTSQSVASEYEQWRLSVDLQGQGVQIPHDRWTIQGTSHDQICASRMHVIAWLWRTVRYIDKNPCATKSKKRSRRWHAHAKTPSARSFGTRSSCSFSRVQASASSFLLQNFRNAATKCSIFYEALVYRLSSRKSCLKCP
jgi:hypothetical protein